MNSNRRTPAKFKIRDSSFDPERTTRQIVLVKGSTGLGFNIIGGDDCRGVFVSFILAGGPADLSGQLNKGDQLLCVNGIDLRYATHSEAVTALKSGKDLVNIVCQYRPEDYQRLNVHLQNLEEQMMEINGGTLKTTQKRSLYVRALFDYDPVKDSGLPSRGVCFRHGDILLVTNASDDDWWQARKMVNGIPDEEFGIIPGKKRIERKEKARLKNVKFVKEIDTCVVVPSEKQKKSKFGKQFLFLRTKERSQSDSVLPTERQTEKVAQIDESSLFVRTYEAVTLQQVKYKRPIILLGPLKDRISDTLLAEYPDTFASCVPHTSRPKKESEVDGREYHFVSSREQMDRDIQSTSLFVDSGQFNDHLYGTHIQSIRDVINRGQHCLLDVSGNAIKKLQNFGYHPIVIFIKLRCIETVLDLNGRWTVDQAREAFERSIKQEQDFAHLFTAIVTGECYEIIYARVIEVIEGHSGSTAWFPSTEKL